MLSHEERLSSVWKKLKAHLEERREFVRAQLEADLDVVETAKLRGRIAQIRELLRAADDPPKTE